MSKKTTIRGFKGFDKNFKCKGVQFEVGKEYEHKGELKLCEKGFHFCEHPFDIFDYYPPNSRFAIIEANDVSEEKSNDDSKRVASKIKIETELGLHALIDAGIKFIFENVSWLKKKNNTKEKKGVINNGDYGAASNSGFKGAASNSGNFGAASNSGISGAASNSGYSGAASNSGYSGAAFENSLESSVSNEGKEGIAVSVGIRGKAKGCIGSWIVLSEWEKIKDNWHRINCVAKFVDGNKIKENTFYSLVGGKLTEQK